MIKKDNAVLMASKYKNDIEYIKQYIINQYKLLKRDDYKHNHQILYNLIKVKVNWQLFEIRQSLYLDVKQFIESYLISVDYQDYGYDNICFTKIMEVVDFLEIKQRISIMYYTKRLFYIRGYDIEFIVDKINDFKIKVAWSEKSYLEYILLLIGSSFISLLITLLIFVVIISLIMTPAPFENMEIFKVELRKFSTSPLLNQLINSTPSIILCKRNSGLNDSSYFFTFITILWKLLCQKKKRNVPFLKKCLPKSF